MQRFVSTYRFGKVLAAVFSAPSFRTAAGRMPFECDGRSLSR